VTAGVDSGYVKGVSARDAQQKFISRTITSGV
jgi:hypothetical protein